jgi:hypothetical protein
MSSSALDKDRYFQAKKWYNEAKICYKRSFIIHLASDDVHGAIEALQHAHELCHKALRVLFGLPFKPKKKGHDPTSEIDEVMKKYFEIYPDKKGDPLWNIVINWSKRHGEEMAKFHNITIYGDNGKFPSELFTDADYNNYLTNVSSELEFWGRTILYCGNELNVLTSDEKKTLINLMKQAIPLRENSQLRKEVKRQVEEFYKK